MLSYDRATGSMEIDDPDMLSFLGGLYQRNRYLEQVSDADLCARFDGLVACIVTIDFDGKPYFEVPNHKDGMAFVELMEELRIRKWNVEAVLDQSLCRFFNVFERSDIERISKQLLELSDKKCLFKFTKNKYAHNILNGEVRLKSAASYNAEGFNIAIKDDELNMEYVLKGLRMQTQDGAVVPVNQNKLTAHAAADYYLSCFSVDFDLKLFALFECDTCVVIMDAGNFVEAVKGEYVRRFSNHHISFGRVEYIDPYRQQKGKRAIEFRKSINFSYEKEWRFVSFPECIGECIESVITVEVYKSMFDYRVIRANKA